MLEDLYQFQEKDIDVYGFDAFDRRRSKRVNNPYDEEEEEEREVRVPKRVEIVLEPHDRPDNPAFVRSLERARSVPSEIAEQKAKGEFDARLAAFRRPEVGRDYMASRPALEVYLLDIDYHTPDYRVVRSGRDSLGRTTTWTEPDLETDDSPVLRIFGLTPEAHSVLLYVTDYAPYCFVRINATLKSKGLDDKSLERFETWLNTRIMVRDPRPPHAESMHYGRYVRRIERRSARSIFGYERDASDFLRIETIQPRHVPLVRDLLQGKGSYVVGKSKLKHDANEEEGHNEKEGEVERHDTYPEDKLYGAFEVFEADVQYVLNFMIDKNLKGCGWMRVPREKLFDPDEKARNDGRAQLFATTSVADVEALPDKSDVPALRVVSVDIECAGRDGRFPLPAEDPIICISALMYKIQDGAKPTVSVALAVGPVAEPTHRKDVVCIRFGSDVVDEKTGVWNKDAEIDMLLAFWRFVVEIADADFLSGYNSDNFDSPYLIKRADALGIGNTFRRMSRLKGELCTLQKSTFSSKAFGTRSDLNLRCPGRISWDVMRITRREMKLRSYSLNAVAEEVVGERKHEISHDRIGPSWIGPKATPDTRRRVLEYNEHDARLSYAINARKLYLYLYQELARATGVPIDRILKQGQSVKTMMQVLRESRSSGYLVPTFYDYKEKCFRAGFPELAHKDLVREEIVRKEIEEEKKSGGLKTPASSFSFLSKAGEQQLERHRHDLRWEPRTDRALLVVCKPAPHDKDLLTSRKEGVWASTKGHQDDFQNAFKAARNLGGRALIFFTVFQTQKLYGVAEITSELRKDTTAAHRKRWVDTSAYGLDFGVRWVWWPNITSSSTKPMSLPMELERALDGTTVRTAHAEQLLHLCKKSFVGFGESQKKSKLNADGEPIDVDEIEAYEGAIVIDPILGFYQTPIVVRLVSSMYFSVTDFFERLWIFHLCIRALSLRGISRMNVTPTRRSARNSASWSVRRSPAAATSRWSTRRATIGLKSTVILLLRRRAISLSRRRSVRACCRASSSRCSLDAR
jgi:DNA polymerase elongation subunit (family B)